MTKEQVLKYVEFNRIDQTLDTNIVNISKNTPQTFTVRFNDGKVYSIFIHYNRALDNWIIDFYLQNIDGTLTPQVTGVLMECGLNLLMNYKYLGIGEFYIYSTNIEQFDSPSSNDLNLNFVYLWRHN